MMNKLADVVARAPYVFVLIFAAVTVFFAMQYCLH